LALNEKGQQFVSQAVKQLPLDEVNLAWRSQLNEKLLQESSKVKSSRMRVNYVWRPMAGVAVGAALALALIAPRGGFNSISSVPSIEVSLMQAHISADQSHELIGSAYVSNDFQPNGMVIPANYEWQESDLGAL
jgi:hypothetical protein